MARQYLWGIINAIMHRLANATAESINASTQKIKLIACGYRNRSRFRAPILFHRAGLSMLPAGVCSD